ncbi:hypothetical protein L195_g006342 [Trifolium pratense]|uniref:Uncharacterized protein n=1 Tax=Trifolium pratense TaxID=57577 RepID=A0A2K3P3B1_TRIPR|nr:hypothetical protein L195_g006342 [Trifolium pratense]
MEAGGGCCAQKLGRGMVSECPSQGTPCDVEGMQQFGATQSSHRSRSVITRFRCGNHGSIHTQARAQLQQMHEEQLSPSWSKPYEGWLKINMDAGFFENQGNITTAWRQANMAAHSLARAAISWDSHHYVEDIPLCIELLLMNEMH